MIYEIYKHIYTYGTGTVSVAPCARHCAHRACSGPLLDSRWNELKGSEVFCNENGSSKGHTLRCWVWGLGFRV